MKGLGGRVGNHLRVSSFAPDAHRFFGTSEPAKLFPSSRNHSDVNLPLGRDV